MEETRSRWLNDRDQHLTKYSFKTSRCCTSFTKLISCSSKTTLLYLFRTRVDVVDNNVEFVNVMCVSLSMDHLIKKHKKNTHISSIEIHPRYYKEKQPNHNKKTLRATMSLTINMFNNTLHVASMAALTIFTSIYIRNIHTTLNEIQVLYSAFAVTSLQAKVIQILYTLYSEYAVNTNNALFQHAPSLYCTCVIYVYNIRIGIPIHSIRAPKKYNSKRNIQ